MNAILRLLAACVLLLSIEHPSVADLPLPKFVAQPIDQKVSIGYGIAVGNVDGDGKLDILLADQKEIVWYRNGDWQRFVMAANLTPRDNVCIAARDIDGDGRVEVAIGGNWNPGETADASRSGAVYCLIPPKDRTQRWQPVELHHEPTVHRMAWIKAPGGKYQLLVVPLHGRGNKDGKGAGARVLVYDVPPDPRGPWTTHLVDDSMHLTHNFEVVPSRDGGTDEDIILGGLEGVALLKRHGDTWRKQMVTTGKYGAVSEVRTGRLGGNRLLATIEPLHGNTLAAYVQSSPGEPWACTRLTDRLKEGHGLACADLLGIGSDQIVVGWRNPNAAGKVGIELFVPLNPAGSRWKSYPVDDNTMACEDLKVADLDGDGRPDIIASGRASHNLVIYWNRTGSRQ